MPFSQAVLTNDNTLYISGTLGINPETNELINDNITDQVRQALVNVGYLLEEVGCNYENVVKATVLLADIKDFNAMNEVYKEFFKQGNYPARTAFQVAALPKNARFEIEIIAKVL